MSDEPEASSEKPQDPAASSEPRVRRISNPRPKKAAKRASNVPASAEAAAKPEEESKTASPVAPAEVIETSAPIAEGVKPVITSESSDAGSNDWPEAEPATTGGSAPGEGSKKKRRRKKGKGGGGQGVGGAQPQGQPEVQTASSEPVSSPQAQQSPNPQQQPHPQPRHRVDPELLAKRAWKIYLAEISEEGVALVGDGDARELSRRCFRLAEIFLEEQSRRR